MKFDELVRMKALQLKATMAGQSDLSDTLVDRQLELPEVQKELKLRQVCAMVVPELFQKLEATCEMLTISKRVFITQALFEAIERAETIVAEVDPYPGD